MPTVTDQNQGRIAQAGALMEAFDAIRNPRAFLTIALTFVVFAVAVVGLGGFSGWLSTHSSVIGGLLFVVSALVWIGIILVGTTAAGILLSDDVWGRERRTIGSALQAASVTAHRLAVLILLAGTVLLAYLILLALVLFLCRIPVLGPFLYAVVFPVAAIATGLLIFALFYVMLPLAAPCVWNGEGINQILATLKEVLRNRLFHVLAMLLVLGLIVLAAAAIVGFIILTGSGLTMSLSLAIVGGGVDMPGMLPGPAGMGGGHGVALGLGTALLTLFGAIPATLIGMKGAAIIHKGVIAGLAVDEAAADIQRQISVVMRRVQKAGENALPPKPAPEERPLVCPNALCGAPITVDDAFCIECGQKLK
jgi:hypothetical protein